MQAIVDKAQEFYELNDIQTNPKKSELLVINRKKETERPKLVIGKERIEIPIKKEEEAARFLGVWISAKNQGKSTTNRVRRDIHSFINMVNHKWISTGQIKYLINKVLIPRLEYRLMITALKNKVCEKLFRPVVQLAKRKFQLPSTTPNCLMFHEDIIGIKRLWERYTEHHITEWLIRLNEGGLVTQTTIGRLNQAQIDMLSSKPIWELDTKSIESWNFKNNLNVNTLVIARKLDLDIVNSDRSEALKQAKHPNVRDLREILGNNLDKKTIKGLEKLDIMYLEQLLSAGGLYMIMWSQLKRNKKLSTRGRKAV